MLKHNVSLFNIPKLDIPRFKLNSMANPISTKVAYLRSIDSIKTAQYPANENDVKPQLLPSKTASKQLYFDLKRKSFTQHDKLLSQVYLNEKLLAVEELESDFPNTIEDVATWVESNHVKVTEQYQEYLTSRKNGAPRKLFITKSHALNFLQCIAPTKLVDGAWLYGLCQLWKDHRFSNLIKTYLEELGEGDASQNHVILYKKLLAKHECDHWQNLTDEHFTQGAIQLALGYNASSYIPEVIGYNLGYEQLPLHLLITAYELKELGIDPYYFTLHVTVDNASTGHAKKATQALFETMPALVNTDEFFRRVMNGYKLNQLGLNADKIVASFNLDEEFLTILKSKSFFGQRMHSDKHRFGGRTINEWLSEPENIQEFIDSMIENGWIKRHHHPEQSRFWKLIDGTTGKMFGVFNAYEKQVIYDWIAGNQAAKLTNIKASKSDSSSNIVYLEAAQINYGQTRLYSDLSEDETTFDPDVAELEKKLAAMNSLDEIMQLLVSLITPSLHDNPTGLMAAQLYKYLMYKSPNYRTIPIGKVSFDNS